MTEYTEKKWTKLNDLLQQRHGHRSVLNASTGVSFLVYFFQAASCNEPGRFTTHIRLITLFKDDLPCRRLVGGWSYSYHGVINQCQSLVDAIQIVIHRVIQITYLK